MNEKISEFEQAMTIAKYSFVVALCVLAVPVLVAALIVG